MFVEDVGDQLVSMLTLGSVYALVALGIAVIFNILDLINFAHGELMTIAAYVMSIATLGGVPFAAAVPLCIGGALVVALILERVAFRPVRGAQPATLLLTSFAVAVILQNLYLLIFGGTPREIDYPDWFSEGFAIGGVTVQWVQVLTFATTILVLVGLHRALHRSVIGIALRAAADDFTATRLMGIRANRIILAAFAVSGALAGLAAVFWFAGSGVVTPTSGTTPLLKGFIAAIIGGLGSLAGPVVGGFVLAATESVFQLFLPESALPYLDAIVFGAMITILFVRPQGLLRRRLSPRGG